MTDETAYRINGRVIDRRTERGVRGLRVEAWDRDTRYHDLLGDDVTDPEGRFVIRFTGAYFGDYGGDRTPDVFFRVFLGDELLLSTQGAPRENERATEIEVTLVVDVPGEEKVPDDRVSTDRAIMLVEFLRQSDFRGVGRETKDRAKLAGRVVAGVAKHLFDTVELTPVRPPSVRTNDVVGQEAFIAERNLGAQGVEVTGRQTYDAADAKQQGRVLRDAPRNLKRGDRVELYVDDDQRVKGYAVVRATKATDVSAEEVARIDGEVKAMQANVREFGTLRDEMGALRADQEQTRAAIRGDVDAVKAQVATVTELRAELGSVRRESAEKDRVIAELRGQVDSLRADQAQLRQQTSPERLAALENQLRDLATRVPPRGGGGVIRPDDRGRVAGPTDEPPPDAPPPDAPAKAPRKRKR
jgi:hypothetical protein